MTDDTRLESFIAFPQAEAVSDRVLSESFIDPMGIEGFWFRWYLDGFVDEGHGKVKCLLGRPGSGKTHLLRHFGQAANRAGYGVARIDAERDRISLIDELYRLVASQIDWPSIREDALLRVIVEGLGYPEFTGPVSDFISWGDTTRHLSPQLLRRDLREAIDRFLATADLDTEFAMAIRGWMHEPISGESAGETLAEEWLRGGKLGTTQRKALGLRNNVTRRNARAALSSLASLMHHAGRRGLVVLVDNVGVMAATTRVEGRPYYTRGARDQAYEMIRQLIDESPFTPYLMTVLAGESASMTNVRSGFPSYPALWARLQTEVQSKNPNRFADLIDLDQLWEQERPHFEALAQGWRDNTLEWDEGRDFDGSLRESIGLEWGHPRRIVAESLKERRLGTGGVPS